MEKELEPDQYSEREAQQRRDAALRRALNTPHQPRTKKTTKASGSKAAAKPRRKVARA